MGIALDPVYVSLDMTSAFAPGKVILCGEHAVVYGQPALAVPVYQVKAEAVITEIPDGKNGQILILAPDIHLSQWMHEMAPENPLRKVIRLTLETIRIREFHAQQIEIRSSIPIASGMGSSAAISVAIIRALSAHFDSFLPPEKQSQIAYEIEKLYHGTPSGIDNTTIAFERPVYFVRGDEPIPFEIGTAFHLIIADSGTASSTSEVVAKVRERWLQDKAHYETLFEQIGFITNSAQRAIKAGQIHVLGSLLNRNQELLYAMGVSTPHLEQLIQAAREGGALGAKLSGAGMGGNIIALVTEETSEAVLDAVRRTGAVGTILTKVGK
jgi:mevalonate kinase